MFKRKLFKHALPKRVLPVILSVAMVFQSMPATALAAEGSAVVASSAEETVAADSDTADSAGDDKTASEVESAVQQVDTPEADDTDQGQTPENEGEARPSAPEDTGGAQPATPEETDETASTTATGGMSVQAPDTDAERTETTAVEPESEEELATGEQKGADSDESDAGSLKTELVFDCTKDLAGFEIDDTGSRPAYVVVYSSDNNAFQNVIDNVKKTIEVKVGGAEKPFKDYLSFEWVQKTENAETVLSGLPSDAGSYQLRVSVEKVDGLIGEADPLSIDFRIDRMKVTVGLAGTEVKPQTVVRDFLGNIKESYMLNDEGGKPYDKAAFTDKFVAEVVEIGRDGIETKVDETLMFDKQKDYRLKLNVTFKEEAARNYEPVWQDYWIITVGELAATTVVVTFAEAGAEISTDYVENTPAKLAELVKPDSVKVMYKDAEGKDAEIAGATADPAWYTREQLKLNGDDAVSDTIEDDYIISNGYKYVECESDPVDAGEYFVIYKYDGDDDHVYGKSASEPIPVTIKALPVIIVPEAVTISEGMNARDIAKLLVRAGYTIYYANADGVADTAKELYTEEKLAENQPDFFGVSYSGDADNGRTQYYSPVFVLEQRFTKDPAKEGEEPEVGKWVTFQGEVKNGACEYNNAKGTMEYRIRFTGKKAVYDTDGEIAYDDYGEQLLIDVTDTTTNSAEKNRVAMADEETLDKNAVLLKVSPAAKTKINTDAVRQAFQGAEDQKGDGSLEKPLTKIYDGEPLYPKRAEYKKAKVSDEQKELAADTDASLTYTWEYLSLDAYTAAKQNYAMLSTEDKEKYDDFADYLKQNDIKWSSLPDDGLGKTDNINGSFTKDDYTDNIVDARVYKLHIAYEDEEHKSLSSDADVYFLVERMEILTVADEQRAEYGDSVSNFTNKGFTLYMLPDNVEPEKPEDLEKLEKFEWVTEDGVDIIHLELEDSLKWTTHRLEKDADGVDISGQYKELNEDDTFIKLENAPSQYQYSAYVTFQKHGLVSDWTDWENIYVLTDPFGWRLSWDNYTNMDQDRTLADGDGKRYYHAWDGNIEFNGEKQLRVVVDQSKLPADRTYNGKMVETPGLVKIYDGETDKTAELLNTTGTYDPALVNVEWIWEDKEHLSFEKRYEVTPQYGGTYTLHVSFNGNGTYRSFDSESDEWQDNSNDKVLGEGYSFRITPLDIAITPVVYSDVAAGDPVSTMFSGDEITAKDPDGKDAPDQWVFKYDNALVYDLDADKYVPYVGFAFLKGSRAIDSQGNQYYQSFFTKKAYKDNNEVNNISSNYFKFGKTYTAKVVPDTDVRFPYNTSYHITYKYSDPVSPKRGMSWIRGENTDVFETVETVNGVNTHIIKPRQAIPFVYDEFTDVDGKPVPEDKNYISYRIYAPKEFAGNTGGDEFDDYSPNFVFKNSIKDAGGYVLTDWTNRSHYDGQYITVLFPVIKDEDTGRNKEIPSFNITWENGFTEAFKLKVADDDGNDIALEANLKNAVAPKSLAFNGVNTKMAVGDTQPLDVKITKAQLGDVIKLQYRLEKQGDKNITSNKYASIDPETGVITALNTEDNKPVKVTVEAYSVYLADDGTLKEITSKGVKAAKTSITISDVTAPAIKAIDKIEDDSARLQFTLPDNGYRREIYVVELKDKADVKNWTKERFEEAIAGMKNGQWKGTFAIKPIFISGRTDYSEGKKLVIVGDQEKFGKDCILGEDSQNEFTGFQAGLNYAVYVRNVSAARTLDDDNRVALSANGSVKSFAMTKAQVKGLYLRFDTVEGESFITREGEEVSYKIPLSAKSAQLIVDGAFHEKEDSDRPAAENHDERTFELPIKDKALLNTYLNPKLSYAVYDQGAEDGWRTADGEETADPWLAQNAVQSKYASISNKGKLTLKGTGLNGTAAVWIYVRSDNGERARVLVSITSTANAVTAKPIKMKVGDTVRLADYLEYKLDKAKVFGYRSGRIEITPEQIDDAAEKGYEVTQHWYEKGYFNGEWTITAVSPNKTPFELGIKDSFGYDETGKEIQGETKVKLTSAQLDPVKGLKAVYVDDQRITLNFAHAGSPEAFIIEVKDARNSVVYSQVAYHDSLVMVDKYQRASRQNQQKWILNRYDAEEGYVLDCNRLAYFEKTKTYSYTIDSDKIVRLSAYTISVTPVFRGEKSAKPTTTKAKTTNIPAARDVNLEAWGNRNNVQGILGGCEIECVNAWDMIGQNYYFASGNTYTLRMDNMSEASARITDTLTWKSSNTKVAAIKANPGTYTASLKAVQKGQTTITVTSKITKKVIARWAISVKSVGNGDDYRGDFEYGESDRDFYQWILRLNAPYYEGRLEVLTLTTPLNLGANHGYDRTWITFTAPAFGEYTFSTWIGEVYDSTGAVIKTGNSYKMFLEANQKIYFTVEDIGSLSVTATAFDKLTILNNNEKNALDVQRNQWVSFTAPEKNYYEFGGASISSVRRNNEKISLDNNGISLNAGETAFLQINNGTKLYVTYRNAEKTLTTDNKADDSALKLTFGRPEKAGESQSKYVSFTAPATAKYTFTVKNASSVAYYEPDKKDALTDGSTVFEPMAKASEDAGKTMTLTMEGGKTVVIKVTVDAAAFTGDAETVEPAISVEQSGTQEVTIADGITITAKATEFVSFRVPKADDVHKYTFTAERAEINGVRKADGSLLNGFEGGSYSLTVPDSSVKGGDTIYLEIGSTDDNESGSFKVTDTYAEALTTPGKTVSVNDNGAYWYTFTAQKAGYYTFGATATENKDKATHDNLSLDVYNQVFGSYLGSVQQIREMKLGERLVLKLDAAPVGDAAISTEVKIQISLVDITPLSIGKDATVSTTVKDETKYYSFTAAEAGSYIFAWTQDKDKNGDVSVGMGSSLTSTEASLGEKTLNAGDVRYIKVKQLADKEVLGTLKVTDAKSQTQTLASGVAKEFALEKADDTAKYRFTVPGDNLLGWAVSVSTTAKDDKTPAPSVNVVSSDYKINAAGAVIYQETRNWTKDTTYTLTVTAQSAEETKGSIKIEPVTSAALGDKLEVTKEKTSSWYKTTVAESGRYLFEATKDDENCSVSTTTYVVRNGKESLDNLHRTWDGNNESYFEKGDVLYVNAYNTTAAEKQTAAIKAPQLMPTKELKLDTEEKLEQTPDGKTVEYYLFTPSEKAVYEFATTGSVTIKKYVPEYGSDWVDETGALEAKESILVVVYAGGSVKVTKKADITVLKDGEASGEITIKPGENAYFSYHRYEAGYFTFKGVSDAYVPVDISSADEGDYIYGADESYKGFYEIYWLPGNEDTTLTVPNNTDKDIKVNVTAAKVTPTKLELDKEVPITVQKGEAAVLEFFAPTYDWHRYKFSSGSADARIRDYFDEQGVFAFERILRRDAIYDWTDSRVLSLITCDPDKEGVTQAEAKVLVTIPKAADIKDGDTIKAAPRDIEWRVFTAEKAASYTFDVKNDKASADIELYKDMNGDEVSGAQWLEAGDRLYVRVDNSDSTEAAEYQFAAIGKEPVFNGKFDFDEVDVSKPIEFTVPEAGTYKYAGYTETEEDAYFELCDANNEYLFMISKDNDRNHAAMDSDIFLMKGEKVTLHVKKKYYNVDVPVYIRVELQRAAALVTGAEEKTYSLEYAVNNYFAYTAAKDGDYIITTDRSGFYYGVDAHPEEYFYSDELPLSLKKNQTVYLCIYGNSSADSVKLKIAESDYSGG